MYDNFNEVMPRSFLDMKKDKHCPYSILNADLICEHKSARIIMPSTVTLHNHDGYEIVLFLHGDVTIFVESQAKKLEKGDLILIPCYAFHGLNLTDIEHYERIVINIKPQVLQKLSDESGDLLSCFINDSSTTLNYIHIDEDHLPDFITILTKLETALHDTHFGHSILSNAYLAEFMVMFANYSKRFQAPSFESAMSPTVTNIFSYIEENLCNDITVEGIAKHLHHNSDYLSRVFMNTTGITLKHYINAKKISLAQQYLCKGYSPNDVCFMIGYQNYSSFSRRFSAYVGVSPKQFQQNAKMS